MEKYRDWDLLDALPDGWVFDNQTGSPVCGYKFATNGKSVFDGQERALVFVGRGSVKIAAEVTPKPIDVRLTNHKKAETVIDESCARTVNELARKRFEQRLLNDLMVDLMICEIEGWCKMEYIRELRRLLASIARRKSISVPITPKQISLDICL